MDLLFQNSFLYQKSISVSRCERGFEISSWLSLLPYQCYCSCLKMTCVIITFKAPHFANAIWLWKVCVGYDWSSPISTHGIKRVPKSQKKREQRIERSNSRVLKTSPEGHQTNRIFRTITQEMVDDSGPQTTYKQVHRNCNRHLVVESFSVALTSLLSFCYIRTLLYTRCHEF